jgi:hypothetical protein
MPSLYSPDLSTPMVRTPVGTVDKVFGLMLQDAQWYNAINQLYLTELGSGICTCGSMGPSPLLMLR